MMPKQDRESGCVSGHGNKTERSTNKVVVAAQTPNILRTRNSGNAAEWEMRGKCIKIIALFRCYINVHLASLLSGSFLSAVGDILVRRECVTYNNAHEESQAKEKRPTRHLDECS